MESMASARPAKVVTNSGRMIAGRCGSIRAQWNTMSTTCMWSSLLRGTNDGARSHSARAIARPHRKAPEPCSEAFCTIGLARERALSRSELVVQLQAADDGLIRETGGLAEDRKSTR